MNIPLNILQQALHKWSILGIFGSFLLIISRFPYLPAAWSKALSPIVDPALLLLLNITPLLMSFGLAHSLIFECSPQKNHAKALSGALIILVAIYLIVPMHWDNHRYMINGYLLIFTLLLALLLSFTYLIIDRIRWPFQLPSIFPSAVLNSITSLLPIIITLSIALIFRVVISLASTMALLELLFQGLALAMDIFTSLIATIAILLAIQFIWYLGLHGHQVMYLLVDIFWITSGYHTLYSFVIHQPANHLISKQFVETFVVGTGSTGVLALSLLLWLLAKNPQNKQLGKVGSAAAWFNISEPMLFGLPIMNNQQLLLPWLLSGPLLAITAYCAMQAGWVPKPTGIVVPWTTPLGLSGFLATLSWRGGLLQIAQLLLLAMLWLPFIFKKDFLKREDIT